MTRPPRRFSDLRPAPLAAPTTDEPPQRTVQRLFATTDDGKRVLAWLIEQTSAPSPHNASDAQLREAEGARRFIARVHDMAAGREERPDPA